MATTNAPTKWPQSRARRWRRMMVAMYGRRRRARRVLRVPPPPPKFRRPTVDDQLVFWRLTPDLSARAIGRVTNRDHHTVRRHLQPDRGEELACTLGLRGRVSEAREMLVYLKASDAVRAQVEEAIETCRAYRLYERQRQFELADGLLRF